MKIDAGTPEKRPNCEHMSFLEGTVFSIVFLVHFSMNFGSPGRPRGRPKSTVPLTFSTFLLACRFRAAPGVSWDRFGSIFHRFVVDFGTILA